MDEGESSEDSELDDEPRTSDRRDTAWAGAVGGTSVSCSNISSLSSAASSTRGPSLCSLYEVAIDRRRSRRLSSFSRLLCRPPSLARLLTSTDAAVSDDASMPARLPVDVRLLLLLLHWLSGGRGEEVTEREGKRAARSCADMIWGRDEAEEWAEEGVPC